MLDVLVDGSSAGAVTSYTFTDLSADHTISASFTVAPPPAPVLSSPANGATGISVDPTLTWNASSGAASYGLQVATDAGFTNLVVNQTTITATVYAVTGLLNNTQYYWRVNTTNAGGTGAWSDV